MADAPAPTTDNAAQREQHPPNPPAKSAVDAPLQAPGESLGSRPATQQPEPAAQPTAVAQEHQVSDPPARADPVAPSEGLNGDHKATDAPEPPPVMTGALPQTANPDDGSKLPGGDQPVVPEAPVHDDFVRDVVKEDAPLAADASAEKSTGQTTEPTPSEEAPPAPAPTPAVTNGAAANNDVEMTDAAPPTEGVAAPIAGEKRKAEEKASNSVPAPGAGPTATNGESAPRDDEPPAKKAKADIPADAAADTPTAAPDGAAGDAMPPPSTQSTDPAEAKTNGGLKRGNSRAKKDKKPVAPAGRTERRTRSQGRLDG